MKPEKVGSESEEFITRQKQDSASTRWRVLALGRWGWRIGITGLRPVNMRLSEKSKKEKSQTWVAHTFNRTSGEELSFNKPGTRECKLNPK